MIKNIFRFKTIAVIVLVLIAFVVLFVLSVWLLGTAAAGLYAIAVWWKNLSTTMTPAQKAEVARAFDSVGWYWHHPLETAWAWVGGRPLSNSKVRQIWIILNLIVSVWIVAIFVRLKLAGRYYKKNKLEDVGDRDIEKLRFRRVRFNAEEYLKRTRDDCFFLGLDEKRKPVTISLNRMIEHIHVLGGSGTGKTSFIVVPLCVQVIRRGMSVIVIDFKGDKAAIQILSREAAAAGKKFFLFSLHPDIKSNTYNPLSRGSALSKVERVMTALELVYEGEARFYSYCQQAVFLPLIKTLDLQGIHYTLRDIQEILKSSELVERLIGEKMSPGQVKGLTAALTPYADLEVINDPTADVDLAEVMRAGDVVYFDLRSAVAPELAGALGKMIAMDLQALAALRTLQDRPVLIAIDEFQNIVCPAFKNIISKVRSANYMLVLANQALGDLLAAGEDFLNIVVTNTSTKVIFNVEDPGDAEYFARRSGQVVVSSYNFSTHWHEVSLLHTKHKNFGESVHERDKYKIHSNVFLRLPFGKSVVFRRGEVAVLVNHVHLITQKQKDYLEQLPYPEPCAKNEKRIVKTVEHLIEELKTKEFARGGQVPIRQEQEEKTTIQTEEIIM